MLIAQYTRVIAVLTSAVGFLAYAHNEHIKLTRQLHDIQSPHEVSALFAWTASEIADYTEQVMKKTEKDIAELVAIPAAQRTYVNTVRTLDSITSYSQASIFSNIMHWLSLMHPEHSIRDAAHAAQARMNSFEVDAIVNNHELFTAVSEYAAQNAPSENLTKEESYYLAEILKTYQLSGIHKAPEARAHIASLTKRAAAFSLAFAKNIAENVAELSLNREQLAGVNESFVNSLPCDHEGKYHILPDQVSYLNVMRDCTVEATRQEMTRAFRNRGGSTNDEVLKQLISCRDELARALDFPSYAHLNMARSMAETPERAEAFLHELLKKAKLKVDQEMRLLMDEPSLACLSKEGSFEHWNAGFASSMYNKLHFDLDDNKMAEYFPMNTTIAGIFDIYRTFLGVEFTEISGVPLWHNEARLFALHKNTKFLGYLVFDLHPRPYKRSLAGERVIIPALPGKSAVCVVTASFPRATADRPALWSLAHVTTFFHELGHALHDQLSRTTHAATAGTATMRDFVELPSQMLEVWLSEPSVLKRLSSHYLTGEQLPDDVIDRINRAKMCNIGSFTQQQILFALFSLACYKVGADKDPKKIFDQLHAEVMHRMLPDPKLHMHRSFSHLTNYGAQYYGYLWSQVFARDLFSVIKERGLTNPEVGDAYIDAILSKGGSEHPSQLLRTFLGREPNQDAFLKILELGEDAQ
jgi:thimet oligopeptidase